MVKTERNVRFQSQQSISLLYVLFPFLYTNVCSLVVKIIISVTNIRVGTSKIEIEISGMLRHVLKPNLHKIWKQS